MPTNLPPVTEPPQRPPNHETPPLPHPHPGPGEVPISDPPPERSPPFGPGIEDPIPI